MSELTKNQIASNVALLAPVPAVHLVSAYNASMATVAFGSMAYLVFENLRVACCGLPVDVFIYASHKDACPDASPFWRATYRRFIAHFGGKHPDVTCRPQSTKHEVCMGIFWEVESLRPVASADDWCPIAEMTGYNKKKRYCKSFAPEGPMLINYPETLKSG